MLDQILVGSAASLFNLVIHALMLAAIGKTVADLSLRSARVPHLLQETIVIVATGTLLVATHFLEVLVWAGTYALVDAAPPGTDLIYFAFGNYTTLGYGD